MCDDLLGSGSARVVTGVSVGGSVHPLGLIFTNNQKRKNPTVSVRRIWRKEKGLSPTTYFHGRYYFLSLMREKDRK